jgi:hypothetical protein
MKCILFSYRAAGNQYFVLLIVKVAVFARTVARFSPFKSQAGSHQSELYPRRESFLPVSSF